MAKVRALKEARGARVYPQNVTPLGNAPILFTLFKLTYSQHKRFGRGDTRECANPVLGLYTDMWRIKGPFSTWRHVTIMCRNPKSASSFFSDSERYLFKICGEKQLHFCPLHHANTKPCCYLNRRSPIIRHYSPPSTSKSILQVFVEKEHPETGDGTYFPRCSLFQKHPVPSPSVLLYDKPNTSYLIINHTFCSKFHFSPPSALHR